MGWILRLPGVGETTWIIRTLKSLLLLRLCVSVNAGEIAELDAQRSSFTARITSINFFDCELPEELTFCSIE